MAELEGFLTKFAKSDEAPEVWLQLGSSNEFNAEEDKAREDYTKLVESFPETPAGKKAAGRPEAARPGGQVDLHQGDEPARRDDRHGPVSGQGGPGRLLGLLGRPVGPARAARPGEAPREVQGQGAGGRGRQPGQRARPISTRSSRSSRWPGRRSSSRAASTAGWPPSTASSPCPRCS